MTLSEHIGRSLYVAFRFLVGDTSALRIMEISARGVMRSFTALIFAAPAYFLIHWLQFRGPGFDLWTLAYIAGLFMIYAAAWVLFAYLLFHAWLFIGPRQNYLTFMPLYNWGRVFFLLIMLPFFALDSFGILGDKIILVVWLVSLALGLSYKYLITVKALGAPGFPAALFVIFDVLLVLFAELLFMQAFSLPGSQL